MDTFEASNGYEVVSGVGYLELLNRAGALRHGLGKHSIDALREFFRAERDEELGRWRWPENPEYIVLAEKTNGAIGVDGAFFYRSVIVVHEPSMRIRWRPDRDPASPGGPKEPVVHNGDQAFAGAARAYFEAHPERKPLPTENGVYIPASAGIASGPLTFVLYNGAWRCTPDSGDAEALARRWHEEEGLIRLTAREEA